MISTPLETFSIGETAAMVGMRPHTLRAWERRFGAVQPARNGSRQRRYSLEEVDTLKRIKDLASARGISLRLAVAEVLGDLPALSRQAAEAAQGGVVGEAAEGSPWRVFADLDPRALVILDTNGRVVDGNVAFARLTGLLRFELPGRKFSDIVDPYDRAKAVAIYRGTPQRRTGWELNLRTPVSAALYSFDCVPFQQELGAWLIACAGTEVA